MTDNQWVTPPPPRDVTELFPELEPFRRTTTRLHPRLGTPSVFTSSLGAKPLWPADEPWPTCPGSHYGTYDEQPVAAVPLLQLFQRDVEQLPFPEGADLLQVLWCPRDHADERWPAGPKTTLVWRDSAAVSDVIAEVPVTPAHHGRYMLEPCVLHPEPGVVEYPSGGYFLPDDWTWWDRLDNYDEDDNAADGVRDMMADLFEAPGTKVGGWPNYCQGHYWPTCDECGQHVEHLLTVDDAEGDGAYGGRWLPTGDGSETPDAKDLSGGRMQLFYCPRCPGLPHVQYYDR